MLRTFTPSVSKNERQEFVYNGLKFSVEIQKQGKVLKRHLIRDGFVSGEGLQLKKTLLPFQNLTSVKIEINLEMHKASDNPTLGIMHSKAP